MTVDEDKLNEAVQNSQGIIEAGERLANGAFAHVAAENGRTVENQIERMGDRFEYERVDDDRNQRQLDDYYIDDDGVVAEEMPVSAVEEQIREHS